MTMNDAHIFCGALFGNIDEIVMAE